MVEIFIFPESQQFGFQTGKAEGWFITKDPSGGGGQRSGAAAVTSCFTSGQILTAERFQLWFITILYCSSGSNACSSVNLTCLSEHWLMAHNTHTHGSITERRRVIV